MKHPLYLLLMGAALCGGASRATLAQTALAQTAAEPAPKAAVPAAQRKRMHRIEVKNVPASLMAFWLDPKNHPVPGQFQQGIPMAGVKNTAFAPAFHLPPGIDRIVAIDPQHMLLVFGTDQGVRELTDTITFLDRPLRQVEIETQWVQVSPEDARAFGINYTASQGNFKAAANGFTAGPPARDQFSVGFVRGNYAATLARLVTEKRAVILTAPRVIAINNLQASLGSFNSSSAQVNFKSGASPLAPLFEGATQIGIEYGLAVTPTINNDDTVTILMSTSSKLKITTAAGDELVSPRPRASLETIVNVRDGDTFVLGGLTSPTPDKALSTLLIFVTARIVRRAGDDVKPVALRR